MLSWAQLPCCTEHPPSLCCLTPHPHNAFLRVSSPASQRSVDHSNSKEPSALRQLAQHPLTRPLLPLLLLEDGQQLRVVDKEVRVHLALSLADHYGELRTYGTEQWE